MSTIATVQSVTVAALVVVGCVFLVIGTIGLLRLPNVYNRMHATSKPTTLGTAAIFLAGFVHFGPGGAGLPSLVGIVFLFLTVPTGSHMISRAAQKTGVPFLYGVTWPADGGTDEPAVVRSVGEDGATTAPPDPTETDAAEPGSEASDDSVAGPSNERS